MKLELHIVVDSASSIELEYIMDKIQRTVAFYSEGKYEYEVGGGIFEEVEDGIEATESVSNG